MTEQQKTDMKRHLAGVIENLEAIGKIGSEVGGAEMKKFVEDEKDFLSTFDARMNALDDMVFFDEE